METTRATEITGGFKSASLSEDPMVNDRTPTFTPTKRYNGYTLAQLHSLAGMAQASGSILLDDGDLEIIERLAKLLTEPRK